MTESLQKTAISNRLLRGTSNGVFDPGQFFKVFQLRCYTPQAEYADVVANFWVIRWDATLYPQASYDYLLTQPSALLFLTPKNPLVMGVVATRLHVNAGDSGMLAGIRFKPGGLHPYWQRSMAELANKSLAAHEVFPGVDAAFIAKLYASSDDAAVVAQMETLLQKPGLQDENITLVNKIIHEIEQNSESHTVASLATMFHMNERTLRHLFHTYVGVGAKWVIARTRLLAAARQAHSLERPDWTTIAANLGYSTQSHFVNDFKKYIGSSPSQYVKTIHLDDSLPVI